MSTATIDVGIVEHDHRGMAAELHRGPLHVPAGERGELLADRRRAGEADLADDRMRDQVLGDLRRDAVDQADDARRHARIDKGPDQRGRRRRGFLRRLDDDRAAGGERRRQLAHHLVDREVPGREGGDRADRQLEGHLHDVGRPGRDHLAIGALGLARRTSR